MSDLAIYHAQEDLREQLRLQKKLTAKYKAKWRAAVGEHELPTDKARKLIKRAGEVGNVAAECRRIGAEVGLTAQTVRALWYAKT